MLDDINDIINKNLPAQVGEVLRKRLALADEADKKIVEQGNTIRSLQQKVAKLEEENAAAKAILTREERLVIEEQKLHEAKMEHLKNTAVLEARREIIANMLERDERILGLVFGNNRFKYNANISEQVAFPPHPPTASNQYPCPQSANQSRSVVIEGEGQVPPGPTGPITPQQ